MAQPCSFRRAIRPQRRHNSSENRREFGYDSGMEHQTRLQPPHPARMPIHRATAMRRFPAPAAKLRPGCALPWCCRAAARWAPIRGGCTRRCMKRGWNRNGFPVSASAPSMRRLDRRQRARAAAGPLCEFWDRITDAPSGPIPRTATSTAKAATPCRRLTTALFGQPGSSTRPQDQSLVLLAPAPRTPPASMTTRR